MKLTIAQSELHQAVKAASQAVGKRGLLPIINCLLLEATADNRLTVTGTDLEIRLSQTVPATVNEPGAVCVTATTLAGVIGSMADGVVTLVGDGRSLVVTNAVSKAKLACAEADDYPPAGAFDDVGSLVADPAVLAAGIRRTVFACATDQNRPVLASLLWRLQERELTLAAADGFRLAVMPVEVESIETAALLIPARAAMLIEKLCGSEPVTVRWTAGQVCVESGGVRLVGQQIPGTFPTYVQLIPTNPQCTFDVDREQLLRAVDFVGQVGEQKGDNGRYVIVRLTVEGEGLHVRAMNADTGDAEAVLPVQATAYDAAPVQVAVESRYCRDALRAYDSERVHIEWTSPSSPINVRSDGCAGVVTVMPMFVQW